MKKVLCILFWTGLIGGVIYYFRTKPQMKEYCEIFKHRLMDLIEHIQTCHHKNMEEKTGETDV